VRNETRNWFVALSKVGNPQTSWNVTTHQLETKLKKVKCEALRSKDANYTPHERAGAVVSGVGWGADIDVTGSSTPRGCHRCVEYLSEE
jgi:hypothetical protein